MSNFIISTRYANALIELSETKNIFDKVSQDMTYVNDVLSISKELRTVLKSPIISPSKKVMILNELFKDKISREANSFLNLIVNKNRENMLPDITKRFLELRDQKLNRLQVYITSAIELSDEQKKQICEKMESLTDKIVVPNYLLDQSIIGGFKARYGDTVIDASLKNQLHLMKKKLLEQSYQNN